MWNFDWQAAAHRLLGELQLCGVVLAVCAILIGWLGGGWWWLAAGIVGLFAGNAMSAKI
jgi:hypothetical protein